jgi:hypothetical protein
MQTRATSVASTEGAEPNVAKTASPRQGEASKASRAEHRLRVMDPHKGLHNMSLGVAPALTEGRG